MDNINVEVKLQKQIGDVKIVMLKGDDGASIASIDKTSTEGLVDTYTITLTDGRHTTFQVTNGSSIATIEKTASIGHTDIYTITLTDGSTSTFEVTNGDNWIDNDEKTATDFFETINGGLLSECKVALSPIQDLHGYDSPWVGGSRKNLLPLTVDGIKSANSGATWTGNSAIIGNVTYTILTDSDGNVIGINANGLSNDSTFRLSTFNIASNSYILNGTPSTGSSTTYRQLVYNQTTHGYIAYDNGGGASFTLSNDSQISIMIVVANGIQITNQIFYPMVRLATETDPTFEPYENICPISGHTQVEVGDDGKNKLPNTVTSTTINGVTFTVHSDGTVTANGTATNVTAIAYEIIALNGTYILNGCPSGGGSGTYELQAVTTITSRDYGDGVTFTANGDCLVQILVRQGVTLNNVVFKPMIRLASDTDPTFVPYNGYQVTVNLGGTYYSGTLDVVSGVLMATYGMKDLGLLNWSVGMDSISQYFYADVSDIKKSASPLVLPTAICEIYKPAPSNDVTDYSFAVSASHQKIFVRDTSIADVPTFVSRNTGYKIVYELATPTPIQLSPTMVKALVGENHLDAPLEGQEIDEVKYRYVFTWDDVNGITDGLKDRIDDIEDVLAETSYTSAVSCLVDDTTCTITDSNIKTTSLIEVFSSNSSGDTTVVTNIAVTNGQAVLTFDALVEATSFKLRITNL